MAQIAVCGVFRVLARSHRESNIQVREASSEDLSAILAIHKSAFEGFFLTRLGDSFLRLYYSAVLDFDGGILLFAENEASDALGFAAGFQDSAEFYRRLKRRRLHIAGAIAWPLIKSPRLVFQLLASASLAGDRIEDSGNSNTVELSSIAVAGVGRGTGRSLLDGFCQKALRRGAREIVLTTDAEDNDAVNRFYQRAGFALTNAVETKVGRKMNEYRLQLAQGFRPPATIS